MKNVISGTEEQAREGGEHSENSKGEKEVERKVNRGGIIFIFSESLEKENKSMGHS